MADLEKLEKRLSKIEDRCQKLENINEIQQLRYRYWRAIRENVVDDLINCFSKNGKVDYGYGIELKNVKEITDFFNSLMGNGKTGFCPQGHNGEIEITGNDTAKGIWHVEVLHTKEGERRGVIYHEDYVKEKNEWKIAFIKNDYIYTQEVDIRD